MSTPFQRLLIQKKKLRDQQLKIEENRKVSENRVKDELPELQVKELTVEIEKTCIFVSIPSYRDPQIVETVINCLDQALDFSRIFIGVCEQNDTLRDPSCLSLSRSSSSSSNSIYSNSYSRQVIVDSIPFTSALGPCYARERIETILLPRAKEIAKSRGQVIEFVLCIDAHTLFQKHWDVILLEEFEKEKKRKLTSMFFFTGYPPQYNHNKITNKRSWRQCANNRNVFMRTTKFVHVGGSPLYLNHHLSSISLREKNLQRPTYCIGLSAGFIFARVEMIEQVPYLKNVPFAFLGEETAMMMRYFTHGYVPMTCPFQVVQTTYNRSSRPSFLTNLNRVQKNTIRGQSNNKIKELLQFGKESDIGSLGNVKTRQEFEKFVGINLSRKVISVLSQLGISSYDTPEDLKIKYGTSDLQVIKRACRVYYDKYKIF